MKKRLLYALALPALLLINSYAYADDTSRLYSQFKALQAHDDMVGNQLGIKFVDTYQHASSYYDDLVDHYEQDQLVRDVIAEGIGP